MPQPGEIRKGNTETVQWDGSRWQPMAAQSPLPSVDNPSVHTLGIPGLEDMANLPSNLVKGARAIPDVLRNLFTQPAATAKGFVQGASEAATPGRVGLLSLLTAGANLPATLAAAGGQAAAEGARVATDAPNAPHSLPEAALDVAEAGAVPGLAGAEAALAAKAGGQARLLKGTAGAGLGGYEGYKYGGVPGAVAGAVAGAGLGSGKVRLPGRLGVLGDLLGVAKDEALPATEAAEIAPETPANATVNYAKAHGTTLDPANVVPDGSTDNAIDAYAKSTGQRVARVLDPSGRPVTAATAEAPADTSSMDALRRATANPQVFAPDTSDTLGEEVAKPDLMSDYLSSLEGGVGSGKQSFEMEGQRYVPDENGSHVLAPAEDNGLDSRVSGLPPAITDFTRNRSGVSTAPFIDIGDRMTRLPDMLDVLKRAVR